MHTHIIFYVQSTQITRIHLNEKINISNKDVRIYKQNRKSRGTLFYLQLRVALIILVNHKSTPDCHIWYKKVPPKLGTFRGQIIE